jgi:hypothetical protein
MKTIENHALALTYFLLRQNDVIQTSDKIKEIIVRLWNSLNTLQAYINSCIMELKHPAYGSIGHCRVACSTFIQQ